MSEEENKAKIESPTLNTVFASISTALVCIVTMSFSVYVPATKGFFNIGESMIYLSAILFGPFVGAFAGGVGSMLADILLGYSYYAPATLIIKASEGFIVGYLCKRNPKLKRVGWIALSSTLAIIAGALLATIGSAHYSGEIELTVGYITIPSYIPELFWILLGLIVAASIILASLITEPKVGWVILSMLAGGSIMVLGYFIYQMYLLFPLFGIEAIAIAEVPVNIGQMIIGLIIATPASKIIQKTFQLK